MTLIAPHLDDRRFQDLVDDAKRLIQQRCPDWTDHNVSDPGVTLIEAFATMVDQLLYRLNRVPERNYVRFLELIGLRQFPATAARVDVTFWLSAPQQEAVTVPEGTEVATVRTESEDAVVFGTLAPLTITSCERTHVATARGTQGAAPQDEALAGSGLACFGDTPQVGDTLMVGLSQPVPSCALTLRVECQSEGVGVDPRYPPLAWEAWDGSGWAPCDLDRDGTGGLNKSGDIVVHVPASHTASVVAGLRAGWVRCRVLETEPGQHAYRASPRLRQVECFTIGGTTEAVHAEVIRGEALGESDGAPGQRFALQRGPVVVGDARPVLEVAGPDGWEEWAAVTTFADRGPQDAVFELAGGEVAFAPAVREPDGTLRYHGKVPPKGAELRLREYRIGGGRRGNVATGALRVLKSSVPYVARAANRHPAAGGVDEEDITSAKVRGPLLLRTRDRAVTAEDYEQLAREAAPQAARVHCVAAGSGADPGTVKVLVVPSVGGGGEESERLRFEQLQPDEVTLSAIATHLEERRVLGTVVNVEPPMYRGLTVVARLSARPGSDTERVRRAALTALYGYFHPTTGGPDGRGWPFGRPVQAGDVFAVLQRVRDCELVEEVLLFPADPVSGERGEPVQRLDVPANGLVHSYEHQVRVQ